MSAPGRDPLAESTKLRKALSVHAGYDSAAA